MATASKKRQEKVPDFVRQSSSGSTSSATAAANQITASSGVSAHSQALFLQKVRESSDAVNRGDFRLAVQAYTEAIALDPTNHILYTNRSTAFAKIQQYQKSLLDARKARELNPKWAKAYIREGSALQQLGQHADALAAFASGLAVDAQNASLLTGLTEAAIKCPLKETLEPIFQQLQKLKLDKSPFVIISVIGQELLQAGHYNASVQMLESALKIGTCSLKLRGSVFSALSSAYWGLGNIDKAIAYMQKDLQVAKGLGDTEGECRAYGNLGSAYFSKGHYKEALSHDRFQLVLAMRLKDRQTATVALGRLGHVYTAIGDYPNALQSHKQSVLLLKQSNEKLLEAREIGNVGAVYLAMGNFESAVECHLEHLKIAKNLKNSVEEARAFSNLGSAYHYKRSYDKAIEHHKQVLKIAEQKGDKSLEARAYAGLGHAARCMTDYGMAKSYHEKQLDNALQTRDKVAEGRACSNLGIIFHQLAEFDAGLKLHKVHLSIAKDLGDRASQGRALGNIGNAYCAIREYEQAIKYHKQELAISTEVNDRHSEMSTHGNLAVAYQALKMMDSAHQHYVAHLNISRELKDPQSEGRAVCNLGNFHSSRGEYTNSIPYYEQYLMLSQELHDPEGEAKACFCLGYAHFALGNYIESVRYYEQDLSIAQELKDQLGIARAYCNLGLAHKALNNFTEALECQKKCLTLMTSLKNVKGRFRSMGNIGDIHLKTKNTSEAIKFYNEQLQLAKQCNNNDMLASANGSLGATHRVLTQYDKALGFHTQELSIRQDMKDIKGECRAHGNLGSVHMCIGKYMNAYKCYEEQLEKSRELQDSALEANACGNLAITKMNMGNFEEAIGLFEQQLAMLEQVHGNNATYDKGRAFGNLGDCYEALGDFDESIKCHEQYLAIAQNSGNLSDQDKAYRGLGNAHRSVGNLQQALVCFEKRLVVAHELNSPAAKASAYGELGCLHSLLGNFEQAISCLQHQLGIAREMDDSLCEGEAACGLGGVYQQMGEYEKALEYHEMDLKISEKTNNMACQCRAYGNLGLSHESLGDHKKAIEYQEQHLSIAAQMNDRVAKTLAYSSLGRVHHALNNHQKAVEYLRQGLAIAEQLGRMEDEAKIRHRLGLALWGHGDLEACQAQLYKAAELFESIRRDAQFNSEYQLSLFDLQTACYQALQRVLVTLKRHHEALVVAERACTRAFIDLLMERQAGSEGFYGNHVTDPPPITTDQITGIVGRQKSLVLYFSVASGFLYSWLLTPKDGVVKFHETSMADVENQVDGSDNISLKSSVSFSACSLLDNMVGQIRESMGVESHAPSGLYRGAARSISLDNDSTSDVEENWEQQLEEIGDKLNAENDRTGFLRIVNRHHMFNSSNYSLGSMFSLNASLNASFPGTTVTRKNSVRTKFGNKSAITALYQLLIEPFEEKLSEVSEEMGCGMLDLILVLQGELYLIPFTVLRKDQTMEYLFERFNLVVVPSLSSLQNVNKHDRHGRMLDHDGHVYSNSGAVVIGNPKLTPAICQHWHLHDIPSSEYEARIVGEILTARPLIGQEATKGAVLNQIEQVEVIHFATHISWKLASVILSPGEVSSHSTRFPTIDSDDSSSDISTFDGPSLAEYLLTAADILNLKLHAKLVILSAGYTDDRAGRINSDGVVGLTRALLSAGAQCVIYCLWPIPDQASKLFMRTLYIGLQDGKCVSQAVQFAVKTVQSTKQFSHPSNWGGWVLLGRDIKLSSKVAQMGHAICELLQHPGQCREAMRVLLHLIEKSLQRIHQGVKNSMYTTAQSIENKVAGLPGWKDLLQAVGFRFEPSLNGLPPAVFFPMSDPGGRLTQASASLQALLGLPHGSTQALAKFLNNYDAGEAIIRVMRDILSKMAAKDNNMDVKVNVKLWRVTGCHEFLASLSMDLVEVGDDDVTLRLGKQANKRHLQFALQSLVSVFDTQEAPRSLALDSSSSLESLSSSHSGSTSTSNFSKGSTPPLSPRSKKRSLFNPAEMEKMRIRNSRMSQGGLTGRKLAAGRYMKSGVNDPSVCLQYQNQIKNMYRSGGSNSQDSSDVCVTALSDTDTQNTDSPTLGSSSASDRFMELKEIEAYDLSIDGRSDRSDIKSYAVEVRSDRSSLNEDIEPIEITEVEVYPQHNAEEDKQTFERNGETRHSDVSDASSASQGIQADKDFGKRSSDVSDINSEGRLTPRNQRDLETFLQVTDESGIVSEATSSNHSEASQQSDQANFRFDPSDLAQKIMSEVTEQKVALDAIQQLSLMKSAKESSVLRSEYTNQMSLSQTATSAKTSLPNSSTSGVTRPSDLAVSTNSVQSKVVAFSGHSPSAFTSPTHAGRPPPPPIAAKPTFKENAPGFRALSSKFSDLSKISSAGSQSSINSDTAGSTSANISEDPKSGLMGTDTTTLVSVTKKGVVPVQSSPGAAPSMSSFRPQGKPVLSDSVSQLYRPDSTTSTSSYCSSVKSVIYKPLAEVTNDSPCVISYDSSSEQTSGSGSTSTITPTIAPSETYSDMTNHKRDVSPALSSCSSTSTSSKGGKQKKKVSFSDSEPSDTPSPLSSSVSSSQLSYFDMKIVGLGGTPPRSPLNSTSYQQQYSRQTSSTSSVDSAGGSKSAMRPPPPSYQYAIRNSQYIVNRSSNENLSKAPYVNSPLRQNVSPGSSLSNSLNNSLDDIHRVPPNPSMASQHQHHSPVRQPQDQYPQSSVQNSPSHSQHSTTAQHYPLEQTGNVHNYANFPNSNHLSSNKPLPFTGQNRQTGSVGFNQSGPIGSISHNQMHPGQKFGQLPQKSPMSQHAPVVTHVAGTAGTPYTPVGPNISGNAGSPYTPVGPNISGNAGLPYTPVGPNISGTAGNPDLFGATRSDFHNVPESYNNQLGQQFPHHSNMTPMSPRRGQVPNSMGPVSTRPNTLQFSSSSSSSSSSKPTLLREPLSPETGLAPSQEGYPAPQTQFRGGPETLASPQRTVHQRLDDLTQGHNQGQGHLSQSQFSQIEPRASSQQRQFGNHAINPVSPRHVRSAGSVGNLARTAQLSYSQHSLPQTATSQVSAPHNIGIATPFYPSNQQPASKVLASQIHSSPVHQSRAPVLNHTNASNTPQNLTNHISPVHQGRTPLASQRLGQPAYTNQSRDMPPKKNPPVPPARIDSWENMDRYNNSVNTGEFRSPTHVPNQIDSRLQNGSTPPPPLPPKGQMLNNGVLPNQQTGAGNQNSMMNGNLSTFKGAQGINGPLKRVDIGSNKKSFARTNVIQASKC